MCLPSLHPHHQSQNLFVRGKVSQILGGANSSVSSMVPIKFIWSVEAKENLDLLHKGNGAEVGAGVETCLLHEGLARWVS